MVWRMSYVFFWVSKKLPTEPRISEPESQKMMFQIFAPRDPITERFRGWGWGDCNHFRLLQGICIYIYKFHGNHSQKVIFFST